MVPATLISHEELECLSPPADPMEPGQVPVWVTLNGYTDERGLSRGGDPVPFQYFDPPSLDALQPHGTPTAGGALITVTGTGLVDHSGVVAPCQMDDPVLCGMHRSAVGVVRADVWHRGLSCIFEGREGADGTPMAQPVIVPATRVDNASLTCRTPSEESLRLLASAVGPWCARLGRTPWCDDPAYAASGVLAVAVRVTLNGDISDTSSNALAHMLFAQSLPRLDYVQPWGGPEPGGTTVSIVGEGLLAFGEQPVCRFGTIEVRAQLGGLNASERAIEAPLQTRVAFHDGRSVRSVVQQPGRVLTCTSPPGHTFGSRTVRLSVSLNGEHFSTSTLSWRYFDAWVGSVSPHGGPLAGGTEVVVHVGGFGAMAQRGLGGLRCVFGGEGTVVATLVGSAAPRPGVRCLSPRTVHEGTVPVSVSVNGQLDALAVPEGVNFTYFDERNVVVSSMQPSVGPILGGTAVTVFGVGFVPFGPVQCRFGNHEPSNATTFTTSTALICHSPPHSFSSVHQRVDPVAIRISLNGEQYLDGSGVPNREAEALVLTGLQALLL